MAQLIAKATSTANAFGPGSATAYGVSLANASHPIMNSTSTFSNVLDGSGQTLNKALSATSLQRALDNHKTALKMQNGDFVGNSAGIYELRVPRALEQAARVILQSQDKTKLIYAGTGSNAALLNTFTFSGNTVELKVIEPRGRTLKDGTTLGSSTLRALVNPEVLKEGKALRIITLWNENVETHYDFDTKNYFASIDLSFSVDHY